MIKKYILFLLLINCTLFADPQTIVFDFGGVLTNEPNREIVTEFLKKSFNLSDTEFEQVRKRGKKLRDSGFGMMDFWLQYANETQTTLPEGWVQDLTEVIKEAIGINPTMFALVHKLKESGFQVAMLSNVDIHIAKLIREFGYYDSFDPCLLSYELGVEKPNQEIYEILCEKIGRQPNELIFIDDKIENIEAAKELGIDGILFISYIDLLYELSKRGIDAWEHVPSTPFFP